MPIVNNMNDEIGRVFRNQSQNKDLNGMDELNEFMQENFNL